MTVTPPLQHSAAIVSRKLFGDLRKRARRGLVNRGRCVAGLVLLQQQHQRQHQERNDAQDHDGVQIRTHRSLMLNAGVNSGLSLKKLVFLA